MVKMRRAFWIQIGGLSVTGLLLAIVAHFFPVVDVLSRVQREIMGLGFWSAIWYPFLYAGCNVLLLPAGFLSIGGGFFFGLWWGFFIVLIGNVSGAAISFVISRYVAEKWLRPRLRRNRTLRFMEPALAREGWKIILLSQLHPFFPTSLLNYLYGLSTIRFRTCMLWVAVGQAPGLFLYAYLGTLGQFGLHMAQGTTHPRLWEYFVWGGGLVLSFAILYAFGQIALRLLQDAEASAALEALQPITPVERKVVASDR